ncbi:MAG TPA: S8 family serine peptidase [Aquabacterium sp.]|uniref:S8 family serine peptidase n=1 Tax=Aquabacterium sp. TaxID=1872578 RepID=UPI002E35F2B2|nr:S8 family serine peptidase [Aquabacterium sp.]HEX5372459.1 S8 family serine peptidase [Aquabacterium sp.]
MIRKWMALCGLVWGLCGAATAGERLAMGLIVKLKGAQPSSVVHIQASVRPKELPSQTRQRISALMQRRGVSFLVQRPTVFGAQLVHNARPMSWSEAERQARALKQDPDVEWVVINEIAWPQATAPNDPLYSQQTWLSDSAAGAIPNVPAAYDRLSTVVSDRGRALDPVVVAVLDTGVVRHPDLVGGPLLLPGQYGYDFVTESDYSNDGTGLDPDASDPGDYLTQATINQSPVLYQGCEAGDSSWHGTMTMGVLAAVSGNGRGVAGMLSSPVLPVSVLPVRVSGSCGASVSDIIEGMLWAAGISYNGSPAPNPRPARVLSLSFGGAPGCYCANKSQPNLDGGACLYQNAIDALSSKGAVLVASAGNDGASQSTRPASCPGVLAVTALDADGSRASYGNAVTSLGMATMAGGVTTANRGARGPLPDADAPADEYLTVEGTSFSAPIAAGALAMMWSVNPGLTVQQLLDGLRAHGVRPHIDPVCSGSLTQACGPGILDVALAVDWAASQSYGAYAAPDVSAAFFTPERAYGSQGSGGGGGAMSFQDVIALGLLAAWAWVQRGSQATKPLPVGRGRPARR